MFRTYLALVLIQWGIVKIADIMKQERTICHIAAIPTAVDQSIRNQTIFAPMGNASGEMIKMKSKCIKCGVIKEIVCTVDGNPWCEECFDKALGPEEIIELKTGMEE